MLTSSRSQVMTTQISISIGIDVLYISDRKCAKKNCSLSFHFRQQKFHFHFNFDFISLSVKIEIFFTFISLSFRVYFQQKL